MKPIIGIVGRPHTTITEREAVCVFDDYRTAISNSGGIPIVILPTQNVKYERVKPKEAPSLSESEKQDIIAQINLCDGLVFPGGNRMYDYDFVIGEYAMTNNINILGICMGMQLLACLDCKENRESVLDRIESNIQHNQLKTKYVHKVMIEEKSKLYEILKKDEINVNSRHKFCVTKTNKFKVVAKSEDGFIEAIEKMDNSFVLGVQWHPESMEEYDENMKKLIKYFVDECKKS